MPAGATWRWDALIVQCGRDLAERGDSGLPGRLDMRKHVGRPRLVADAWLGEDAARDVAELLRPQSSLRKE